eukprot:99080-Prymnesium_polylepis.1
MDRARTSNVRGSSQSAHVNAERTVHAAHVVADWSVPSNHNRMRGTRGSKSPAPSARSSPTCAAPADTATTPRPRERVPHGRIMHPLLTKVHRPAAIGTHGTHRSTYVSGTLCATRTIPPSPTPVDIANAPRSRERAEAQGAVRRSRGASQGPGVAWVRSVRKTREPGERSEGEKDANCGDELIPRIFRTAHADHANQTKMVSDTSHPDIRREFGVLRMVRQGVAT